MYKLIILSILYLNLIANNDVASKVHVWSQNEEPSIENNFQKDKKIYQTNNMGEAIGATIFEGLFHLDTLKNDKKLNTDFKYLEEFDKKNESE